MTATRSASARISSRSSLISRIASPAAAAAGAGGGPAAGPARRPGRAPRLDRLARVAAADLAAVRTNRAGGARPHPRDRLGELALPVPGDARDGDDLARPHRERDPLQ